MRAVVPGHGQSRRRPVACPGPRPQPAAATGPSARAAARMRRDLTFFLPFPLCLPSSSCRHGCLLAVLGELVALVGLTLSVPPPQLTWSLPPPRTSIRSLPASPRTLSLPARGLDQVAPAVPVIPSAVSDPTISRRELPGIRWLCVDADASALAGDVVRRRRRTSACSPGERDGRVAGGIGRDRSRRCRDHRAAGGRRGSIVGVGEHLHGEWRARAGARGRVSTSSGGGGKSSGAQVPEHLVAGMNRELVAADLQRLVVRPSGTRSVPGRGSRRCHRRRARSPPKLSVSSSG